MGKSMKGEAYENLKEILKVPFYLLLFLGLTFLFSLLFALITDELLIRGNLGETYFTITLALQTTISLLLALFVSVSLYKIKYFKQSDKAKSATSVVAGFLGMVAAGCPACSITLASYIGLAGFLSLLPFKGLELKILSVFLLVPVNYFLLRDMKVCKAKHHKH
ncbi:MAG: hypothetical protein H6500_01425 [Candidatus Woesearchaeota archaeon]|nr:hypothetical protein [Nanoarchaeota archaeon]USN44490.1 MAG: hypothetical protein H6500_01425 [Candidatus Woesearchaeota archaeon]